MARFRAFLFVSSLLLYCVTLEAKPMYSVYDSVSRSRAVEYYYLQARSYYEQDSLDRCFEILQHCHALDPSSASVMYDLSSFYAFLGEDSIAYSMLNRVVESDPSNSHYSKALVNYFLKVGNIESAIKVFEDLLEHSNSKSGIFQYLFSLYAEQGNHEKAIENLEKLEILEGRNEDIAIQKLRQYILLHDSVKAVGLVRDMIKESPDDVRLLTLLGNTYSEFGDRERALDAFKKVLAVKPDDDYALSSLVGLYSADENDSLYCDAVERLLKSEGLDTESRVSVLTQYIRYKHANDSAALSAFMKEMQQLPYDEPAMANLYAHYLIFIDAPSDTIVPALERVLVLEPENVSAIVKLLEYAIERNDADAVIKYTDDVLPYLPDMLELYHYKGISFYILENPNMAIEVLEQGLDKRNDETDPSLVSSVYALLGDLYYEQSMTDRCFEAYDSALVYNSSNLVMLNNYAYYLSLAECDLQRALEMSGKTIMAKPDNATYIDTYAWVLFKLKRYEEAKAYAERLIALNEDESPVVYSHCGDIFAKCGDMDKAVKYWIMAREAGDDSKILEKKIKKRKYYSDAKSKK